MKPIESFVARLIYKGINENTYLEGLKYVQYIVNHSSRKHLNLVNFRNFERFLAMK